MTWARIHDNALTHPKVIGMFNFRDPFHLWIWGISYASQHLTDGFIPREAIPAVSRKAEQTLILKKLWEPRDGGITIHDYTTWNNTKEFVTSKRAKDRDRKAAVRADTPERRRSDPSPATSPPVAAAESLSDLPSGMDLRSPEREFERKPMAEARSRRPIFVGQRLVVFEWMLDDIRKTLGKTWENFGLDEWFYTADAKAAALDLVIPKRDQHAWLQKELLVEVARRGLTVAGAEPDPYADYPTAWQCSECGGMHEGTQEQRRQGVCLAAKV